MEYCEVIGTIFRSIVTRFVTELVSSINVMNSSDSPDSCPRGKSMHLTEILSHRRSCSEQFILPAIRGFVPANNAQWGRNFRDARPKTWQSHTVIAVNTIGYRLFRPTERVRTTERWTCHSLCLHRQPRFLPSLSLSLPLPDTSSFYLCK